MPNLTICLFSAIKFINRRKREAPETDPTAAFTSKIKLFVQQMYNKISNLTCIIEELGFVSRRSRFHQSSCYIFKSRQIGEDKLPNYEAVKDRVSFLPVSDEMVADLLDGIDTCQKLTVCFFPD